MRRSPASPCVWQSTTRWKVELAWWLGAVEPLAPLVANPAEVESVHWLSTRKSARRRGLLESNREFLKQLAAGQE